MTKHWFLTPSMHDPFYVCGGWQIFNRACALVNEHRETETVTYRHREEGYRYLDDIPIEELSHGIIWVTWQSHVTELAERLDPYERVVLYAQNTDFGARFGQVTPPRWPVVCLSRYIASRYAIHEPWRLLSYLGPVLHPAALNRRGERDIDVLFHIRKCVPYLRDELVPALQETLEVKVLNEWMSQEEFFAYLNRSKTYLYWMHQQLDGVFEGFGMQPLEAVACGATPVSNIYGGLSDYLEPPYNARKIGVHSLKYDLAQIQDAVARHEGSNPDEARIGEAYSEEAFYRRFFLIEEELLFYFNNLPEAPRQEFAVCPPPPPLHRRPYVWLHKNVRRGYKRMRGILPR